MSISGRRAGPTAGQGAHLDDHVSMERPAFGAPGMEPRWARAAKDGVGTAYSNASRVWFTVWNGILTEAYYPTVDRPQLRDLQYMITDGDSFLHQETRDLESQIERLDPHVLGYRITNSDRSGRYGIVKDVIADPHLPCILQHTTLTGDPELVSRLKLYVLCAPHLEVGGWGNNAYVIRIAGRRILAAEKGGTWLALAADLPYARLSCGYVGRSDGWTDLAENRSMTWEFDHAHDGNVALTGELDLTTGVEFTLALAFGDGLHNAVSHLLESLVTPFADQRERYEQHWQRSCRRLLALEKAAGDDGDLYRSSVMALRAHEDKSYPGAFIASLSIPWGEAKGDEDQGGYHLVWARDMVNTATGLIAAGDLETPLRAVVYLAASQQGDGGVPQNFWIDGTPHWTGIQLDEVALPILLAWRLNREGALSGFDPYPVVLDAAAYLVRHGPVTGQERWEEASGYSPSTLAATIAAFICAACFARQRGDEAIAGFLEDRADFLECHVEAWTVTTVGTLHPDITRHYVRINPSPVDDPDPHKDPNHGVLTIANRPPGTPTEFPAKQIVDGGFLELVRYGIRSPHDPIVVDSLEVMDRVLKVDTPYGPCWHRYNQDGYGQREDGGPFEGWGTGRAWPLLTGERGHYELAAGRDPGPFIRTMEALASVTGLLPEQVWDELDRPKVHMYLGRPTGSAMPLAWAHAEYIKLVRSAFDGVVFDLIPEVAARYQGDRSDCRLLDQWKHERQVRRVQTGYTLRVQASAAFRLHWSADDWQTRQDTPSSGPLLGVFFVDIDVPLHQRAPLRFTFFWTEEARWEGRDHAVDVG